MPRNIRKTILIATAAAVVALTPGSALAAGHNAPPKPPGPGWVLGCYLAVPGMAGMTTNTRLCNKLGLSLVWFHRGR